MKLHGHDIEVGDKVWSVTYGEGVVQKIYEDPCPFFIKFANETYWMPKKEIFWQPFEIPANAYQKPKKLVEKGCILYKTVDNNLYCTTGKYTKKRFLSCYFGASLIRFVEETVEMVEE